MHLVGSVSARVCTFHECSSSRGHVHTNPNRKGVKGEKKRGGGGRDCGGAPKGCGRCGRCGYNLDACGLFRRKWGDDGAVSIYAELYFFIAALAFVVRPMCV